jgi:hypothetical protein
MTIPAPGTPRNPGQFQQGDFQLTPATPGPQLVRGVDGEVVAATTKEAAEAAAQSTGIINQGKINLVLHKPQATPSGADRNVLKYPLKSPITNNSDYVVFSFFEYAPPFGGGRDSRNTALTGSTSRTNTGGYANYQDSNDRSYANPSNLKPIILYMPEDIQSQFGSGWGGAGFSTAAAGLASTFGAFQTQRDWGAMLQAFGASIPGVVKTTVFKGLQEAINAAGSSATINQTLGAISGTILNPNVELLYEAPKLRTFSLKFKLVPRSKEESVEIKKICNRFKKAMLPSFGGQAIFGSVKEAANLLTIPDLCQVSFMNGGRLHPYLPQYKLCGITDVNINYTAAGAYATLEDGAPVATELTLSFLESKLVFSDEVNDKEEGPSI